MSINPASIRPVGILLAAGQSSRFGSNKLLHPLVDDRPMLLVSAQKLARVLPGSIVVINKTLIELESRLASLGLRVVVNEQADAGMASSIALGVRESLAACGWLIMLADMPYVREDTIRLVADRLVADTLAAEEGVAGDSGRGDSNSTDIVAPAYRQQRGHPVAFAQCYQDELLALHGDTGAREIIHQHRHRLELVAVDDAGVLADVDRPGDLLDDPC